jgi:hypothetical protein
MREDLAIANISALACMIEAGYSNKPKATRETIAHDPVA